MKNNNTTNAFTKGFKAKTIDINKVLRVLMLDIVRSGLKILIDRKDDKTKPEA